MTTNGSDIRSFLAAIGQGQKGGRIPHLLHRLALRALRGTPGQGIEAEAEQLVGELLTRELEAERSGRRRTDWLALQHEEAVAFAKRRLRQLAVEGLDGWRRYKQLRSHVVAALARRGRLPPVRPQGLFVGDRISGDKVAAALAWGEANDLLADRSPNALCGWLQREFLAGLPVEEAYDPEMDDLLDARALAQAVRQQLGDVQSRMLRARLSSRGFEEIARQERVAVSTVFVKVRKAEQGVRRVLDESGASPRVAVVALELLEEAA